MEKAALEHTLLDAQLRCGDFLLLGAACACAFGVGGLLLLLLLVVGVRLEQKMCVILDI
jgi:hypothetical protein